MLFLLPAHAYAGCTLFSDGVSHLPPEAENETIAAPTSCSKELNPEEAGRIYKPGTTESRTMLGIDNHRWGASIEKPTYVILNLGELCYVFGVVMEGGDTASYVTNFDVDVRADNNGTWTKANAVVFAPTSEAKAEYTFDPLRAQHVMIKLTTWEGGSLSLGVGVIACGCVPTPKSPTIVAKTTTETCAFEVNVPERLRTYSSAYEDPDPSYVQPFHSQSMLDSDSAWKSGSLDIAFMIMDLDALYTVYGIVIQGRNPDSGASSQAATLVKVEISSDKEEWAVVGEFPGAEGDARKTSPFSDGVVGRYVKVNILNYTEHPTLRAGVIACPFFEEGDAKLYCKAGQYDIDGYAANLQCKNGKWSRHPSKLCNAKCAEDKQCIATKKKTGLAYCLAGYCVECIESKTCKGNVCHNNKCVPELLGCQNESAPNFNEDATKDDGSCGAVADLERFNVKILALIAIPLFILLAFGLNHLRKVAAIARKKRAAARAIEASAEHSRRSGRGDKKKKSEKKKKNQSGSKSRKSRKHDEYP